MGNPSLYFEIFRTCVLILTYVSVLRGMVCAFEALYEISKKMKNKDILRDQNKKLSLHYAFKKRATQRVLHNEVVPFSRVSASIQI
jgi:hypothetical protein